jgi:glycopeptide antibiotics resistance protein
VLVALIGNHFKVTPLVSLWIELVSIATTLWTQVKGNILVLVVAGILFLFDQHLFVVTLVIVAVIIALGDKVNQVLQTIKLPKV